MTNPIFLKGGECFSNPDFCRECQFAVDGRMPEPVKLRAEDPGYSIDKGKPGEYFPPCAKQQIASLGHWQGHNGEYYPNHLLGLRLFKCRMWLWVVVPGIYDHMADRFFKPKTRV